MSLPLHSQQNSEQQDKYLDKLMSDEFISLAKEKSLPLETLMAYYRCVIMEIETKFFVLNEELSLEYDRNPIETIKSRLKSWESLIKKMRNKNLPMTLSALEENIYDVAGIRVICSFLQNETRHMKAEVQFRTIAMDFWASLEHKLRYKKNISDADAELLGNELLICSQMSAELDERMQTVKNKISVAEKK